MPYLPAQWRMTKRLWVFVVGVAILFAGLHLSSHLRQKPPAADQAAKAIEPDFVNAIGIKFVLIKRATFLMGGGGGRPGKSEVTIPHDYYLGMFEVTQGQWESVMGNNPSFYSRKGRGHDAVKGISDADLREFPVDQVSLTEIQDFCDKLNRLEKADGWTYRLPTEQEWEYACRGAPGSKEEGAFSFYFEKPTNFITPQQANYVRDAPVGHSDLAPIWGRPRKVGSYPPNKLGLFDMHGNVWEWCVENVDGPVIRGGGCGDRDTSCRAAHHLNPRVAKNAAIGFRLARAPAPKK